MAPKPRFVDGEKVLCYHGPLLYEAKCLQSQIENKQMKYFIHYSGWNKSWDEWVSEIRVLKYNNVNLQKQNDLTQKYAGNKKTKGPRVKKEKEEKEISLEKSPTETQAQLTHTHASSKKFRSPRIKKEKEEVKEKSLGKTLTEKTKPLAEKAKLTPAELTPSDKAKQCPVEKAKPSTPEKTKFVPAKKLPRPEKLNNPARIPQDINLNNQLMEPKKRVNIERPFIEEFQPAKKIEIEIPEMLKDWLIDDNDVVNRQKRILHLPARVTVDHIIAGFKQEKLSVKGLTKDREESLTRFSNEIRQLFNVSIGKLLLYKFERPQYADILEEYKGTATSMSYIYGAIHMVRLISNLGNLLQEIPITEEGLDDLLVNIGEFIRYIFLNPTFFKITDYDVATPEYHRRAL